MRLAAAAALGGVIGIERELREREAGFRTHMLVSVGAALFTLVSALRVGRLRVLAGERRHLRSDPHRGADRHRHRLHRRRRDHPTGPLGPRPDDGGDSLDGGRDRHGLRGRLLLGGGHRHGDRARRPRAAARRVPSASATGRIGASSRWSSRRRRPRRRCWRRSSRSASPSRRSPSPLTADGRIDDLRHRVPGRRCLEKVVLRLGELDEVSGVTWVR